MRKIMCTIPTQFKLETMNLYSLVLCDAHHNTKEREKQLVVVHELSEYSAVSSF